MARKPLDTDRIRGGVSEVLSRAVDASVYMPLGIYDRARDQLTDIDATRVRKTFQDLIGDFIDRGENRVQPLERRLRREGRKVKKTTARAPKKTTARASKKTTRKPTKKSAGSSRKPASGTTATSSTSTN